MATLADAKNALAPKDASDRPQTLARLIDQMRPEIARALPKHMDPDRMARVALTLVRQNPQLGLVVPETFLGALMTCSQLGLEPGPLGHAWIIPRKRTLDNGDRILEANFQLGYKGVIELARRSGQVAKIVARTVYSEELRLGQFSAGYEGSDDIVTHQPILIGEKGTPSLYYGIAKLTNAEIYTAFLTPGDVEERHRKRSSAPNSPAWRNDFDSMAWKSCVVEMRRWLPQSPELEQALAMDGQVRVDISPDVLDDAAARASMIFDGEIVDDGAETDPWDEHEVATPGGAK
jgi:recombination protein RecT